MGVCELAGIVRVGEKVSGKKARVLFIPLGQSGLNNGLGERPKEESKWMCPQGSYRCYLNGRQKQIKRTNLILQVLIILRLGRVVTNNFSVGKDITPSLGRELAQRDGAHAAKLAVHCLGEA